MSLYVTLELKVEDLGTYDARGRALVAIHEKVLGTDDEGRLFGPMPGSVSESFCRIRRERFAKVMKANDGVRIFLNS